MRHQQRLEELLLSERDLDTAAVNYKENGGYQSSAVDLEQTRPG